MFQHGAASDPSEVLGREHGPQRLDERAHLLQGNAREVHHRLSPVVAQPRLRPFGQAACHRLPVQLGLGPILRRQGLARDGLALATDGSPQLRHSARAEGLEPHLPILLGHLDRGDARRLVVYVKVRSVLVVEEQVQASEAELETYRLGEGMGHRAVHVQRCRRQGADVVAEVRRGGRVARGLSEPLLHDEVEEQAQAVALDALLRLQPLHGEAGLIERQDLRGGTRRVLHLDGGGHDGVLLNGGHGARLVPLRRA